MLAAAAVGLDDTDDIATTARRMAHLGTTVEPDPATRARYDDLYAVYERIYPAVKDLFAPLTAAATDDGETGA